MTLQRVHRGDRGGLAPDHIGQPVGADDLAGLQRQNREHRLAPEAADRSWFPVDHYVDRPEETNLHDFPRLYRRNPPSVNGARAVSSSVMATQSRVGAARAAFYRSPSRRLARDCR